MPTMTIDFDAHSFNLCQQHDFPALEMRADVSFDVHPAEPDVGIFGSQYDVAEWDLVLDGVTYSTADAFAAALHVALGDTISDTVEEVEQAVKDWIDQQASDLDFDD